MKKNYYLPTFFFSLIFLLFWTKSFSQNCCPEFSIQDMVEVCPPEGACFDDGIGQGRTVVACQNSTHLYTAFPNDPGFTYTWSISGGTPSTFTGNPVNITWGNGSSGHIKVVISNLAFGGSCIDSVMQEICLIEGPNASFTLSPNPVCLNSPVSFTNTSIGGSTYFWDFGDGTTSNLANPPDHYYAAPGTYTVTLSVQDMGAGEWVVSQEPPTEMFVPCGCIDTYTLTVDVLPDVGPEIDLDCCYGTVCPGDTSYFCSPTPCTTFNWSVTGGNIISGAGSNCIAVVWNATYSGPTTVSLSTPSCGSAPCGGTTTIEVPVLYPDLPIQGPTNLCQGSSGSFTLPTLPGTYYSWTVSGGTYTFNQQDRNTPTVNITFNSPGSFWVKCNYDNPLAGCDGVDSLLVDVLPKFIIGGYDIVCEAGTSSHWSNGAANWTINPSGPSISGNGTSNITVSAWTPGTYTISASPVNPSLFCNTSDFMNIEVVPLPILNGIVGSTLVCPNSYETYSISSDTQGDDFIWAISSGTGNIISEMGADKDSIVAQFTGPGPWVLTVYHEKEIAPGIICPSLVEALTINPYNAPVLPSSQTVCADDVITYNAGISDDSGSIEWVISPANQGSILNGQGTGTVDIKWHGPATSATLSVSNCVGSATMSVVINEPPIAIASYNILPVFCLGDIQTLILSTPFFGTYNYQWYENGSPIGPATTNTLTINTGLYTSAGIYEYHVVVDENGCDKVSNIIKVEIKDCSGGNPNGGGGCDAHAYFWTYSVCDQITLLDQSTVEPPATITTYQWSVSGPGTGTFSPSNTVPNPTLTVSASGTYCITLEVTSSSGCTSTWEECVSILLPNADFTFSMPTCEGDPVTFSPIPNDPDFQYFWNFGDGTTSYDAITQHTFSSTGSPYSIMLTITDEYGCTATAQHTVTIDPKPVCVLSYADTIFCPGDNMALNACTGMSFYQWYKNGDPISGANASTYYATDHGEYWVEVQNSYGCYNHSDSVYLFLHQLPDAELTGEKLLCGIPSTYIQFYLNTVYDPDYVYNWYSNPGGATFTPPNGSSPLVGLTLPATLPAYYEFIVEVTDINTGCKNYDTLCVTFFEQPQLFVPYLGSCEGNPVTLTPTPNDPSMYDYLWSSGETTPVIIASNPGYYELTITDKFSGCSATAPAGFIFPKPDLSLFPAGCETICETESLDLYIPLPLDAYGPNSTYPGAYPIISWYQDNDYSTVLGSGENFSYAGSPGYHEISVIVQNSYGCADTAGYFCVSIDSLINLSISTETPCGCDTSLYVELVDHVTGLADYSFTINDCDTTLALCINNKSIYDLVADNGIVIPSAIVNGTINYPHGNPPFYIGDSSLCCFAAYDSSYIKINNDITYSSNTVWDDKYYIADNVIVTVSSGAVLDITNVDVVFGQCAGIVFKEGAYLRANNSVFRPCNIDDSWLGIRFEDPGDYDNIINESTFKNAEAALYFTNASDGVVSNSLFSNCNFGIRVENNDNFDHPISGNRFVHETYYPEFMPCYSFTDNTVAYGIYTNFTRFNMQVSHNEFVSTFTGQYPRFYGIYQIRSGGIFSENTFTDATSAFYMLSQRYYTNIENNEIEVNVPQVNNSASIYVLNNSGPIIEINNNEISNNYNQDISFAAIHAYGSNYISIVNNIIDGFYYGIINLSSHYYQISNNEIYETRYCGILVYEKVDGQGFITCNQVKMKSYIGTYGLIGYYLSSNTEILSNCITDCYNSMYFLGLNNSPLPYIRNNFLYNYYYVGINAVNHSGDIGTPTDPGLNTLWSNRNSAIDINSNTTIYVADNFGMFNLASPWVQVTSSNPFHSTASCGHQIFEMPSQGNLNLNFTCDNFIRMIKPVVIGDDQLYLIDDFIEIIEEHAEPFFLSQLILGNIDQSDDMLLNQLVESGVLSDQEIILLSYDHYLRQMDFNNASYYLNQYEPVSQSDQNFKHLCKLELALAQYGIEALPQQEIETLNQIIDTDPLYANYAISILNQNSVFQDHFITDPTSPEIEITGNIINLDDNNGALNIFPIPSRDKIYIDFINGNTSSNLIQVHDNTGKKILNYEVNQVSGRIEIDIRDLTPGIYFIMLSDAESGIINSGKFIKAN